MELGFLDGTVEREVLERFDHKHLNLDVDAFRNLVPTAENLCIEIYKLLRTNLEVSNGARSARLERIRLEETNSNFFEYEGQ